jgi:hypothetical protein
VLLVSLCVVPFPGSRRGQPSATGVQWHP